MSAAARRVALVIGNSAYPGSPLRNPANDARDIAASLSRIGFAGIGSTDAGVSSRLDLDYNGLRAALADFAQAAHGAPQAVLYYAGHGIEYQGENYLIPVDARLEHARRLDFEAAPLGQILRNVDDEGGLRLIILDACRNNHFRSRLFGARDLGRGLRAVEPQGSVLVAYAAKHGTVAQDGEGRNSPFVSSLLTHIEKPGLEVAQLFREVRDDVLDTTGREQEPHLYGSLGRKQEYLIPPVAAPTPTPFIPHVDAATREHTLWTEIAASRDPLAFEDFLEKFPDGTYSRLAARKAETAIDTCGSVETLEQLIRQHPDSPRVQRAQARVVKLTEEKKPFTFNGRALTTLGIVLSGSAAIAFALVWTPKDLLPTLYCAFARDACTGPRPLTDETPKPVEPSEPLAGTAQPLTPDPAKETIAKIAASTDRETLLTLAKETPDSRSAVEARFAELGYIKVVTGRGAAEKTQWLKEGRANPDAPDSFRDCDKCPEMVVVPAGKFLMGSTTKTDPNRYGDEDDGSGRQVEITIPQPFAVGRLEVTFDEWEACVADGGCKSNPSPDASGFGKGRRPVINVSWRDAQEYVAWINAKAPKDHPYRLLSEAEWEYAARGVTVATPQPPYFFGADEKKLCDYGNVADKSTKKKHPDWTIAPCDDGQTTTSPVGTYRPNAFGLKDTIGNVWEWVEDCYRDSYKDMPLDVRATGRPWLDGCNNSSDRVLRGGSWSNDPRILRSAFRGWNQPDVRDSVIGFRLSRTL